MTAVQLQIISKILDKHDFSIITDNALDVTYFPEYREEFKFIADHVEEYEQVPDVATFLAKFADVELVDVTEPDEYLVNTLREEDLYRRSVPVVKRIAELLKSDANAAAEYMLAQTKTLQPNYNIGGTDLIADADKRLEEHNKRADRENKWYIETGFEELDDLTHGLQRGEELCVLFARLGNGKSWLLAKICAHVWKLGFNVGYMSPEMSDTSVGFRFDTLLGNFSNRGLMTGKDTDGYAEYIEELKSHKNKFILSTPSDFGKRVTVSKLRNWAKQYKLDLIAIDGIKYLTDERAHRNDSQTVTLTNISEDLMELSVELGIPIVIVVQANREGVADAQSEAMPQIENIRDSDGIAQNASKVIALRQKENMLFMQVQKNRFGKTGDKLRYLWEIDTGNFQFVPQDSTSHRRENATASKPKDHGNVF